MTIKILAAVGILSIALVLAILVVATVRVIKQERRARALGKEQVGCGEKFVAVLISKDRKEIIA